MNNSDPKKLLNDGMKYFQAKNYEKATEYFKKLVTLFPQSSLADNAHYNLGIVYSSQGAFNKAFVEFKIVIQEYPDSDAAIFAPDKLDEIKERIDPSSPIFIEGMEFFRKKDFDSAREKFSEIITKFPNGELIDNALFSLAAIEYKCNNKETAIELLQRILDRFGDTDAARLIKSENIMENLQILGEIIS